MNLYHLFYFGHLRDALPDGICIDAFVFAPSKGVARALLAGFTHNDEWHLEKITGITEVDDRTKRVLTTKYKGIV